MLFIIKPTFEAENLSSKLPVQGHKYDFYNSADTFRQQMTLNAHCTVV